MLLKLSVIFFQVIIALIHANDDRNIYSVQSTDDHDTIQTNIVDEVKIVELVEDQELVHIQLFYECLCPGCRSFDTTEFGPTIQELHPYLNIGVYPYGNAETQIENGTYVFTCQHGSEECYGNKLHACAIHNQINLTQAILYNTCMMSLNYTQGSDDEAAQECGNAMKIDSKPIIACANSDLGSTLLYQYGVVSKKVGFTYVPYILINGSEFRPGNVAFKTAVCKTFNNPPPPCK